MGVSIGSLKTESTCHRQHRRTASRPFLVLHILCLLFSLTSVTTFAAAIPSWNANLFHNSGPITGDWADMLPLIPLGLTILFSSYILITLFLIPSLEKKASSQPIFQPRAKTCFLLITSTLVTLAPLLVVAGLNGVFRFWRKSIPSQSRQASAANNNQGSNGSVVICNLVNVFAKECEPTLYQIGELQIGGVVAGALAWLSIFGLWILYCRAWQAERRREARPRLRAHKRANGSDSSLSCAEKSSTSHRHRQYHHHRQEKRHQNTHSKSSRHNDRHHRSKPHHSSNNSNSSSDTQPLIAVAAPAPLVIRYHQQQPPPQQQQDEPHHLSPIEAHKHLFKSLSRSSRSKYYVPTIPLSRNRPQQEVSGGSGGYQKSSHDYWHHDVVQQQQQQQGQSSHNYQGGAIEEARRKLKPRETINSWLAHHHV